MPSFDLVSEIDLVEVKNATDNANRELSTRFDFRGVNANFELKESTLTMTAEGDFQLQQMMDMLRKACAKRNVPAGCLEPQTVERSGKTHKQAVLFKQGIDQPLAKKIIKQIKDAKIKVQTAIQGEQVRVSGKKRDDLQQVIALIKAADFDQPFQYINFRD